MRPLLAILIVVAVGLGLMALIPVLSAGLAFAIVLGPVLIWVLPIVIIAVSGRTTGPEKVAWILAIVFLSWFAWIFYFLLAPLKPRPHYRVEYRPR